jgi:hypothetical protein
MNTPKHKREIHENRSKGRKDKTRWLIPVPLRLDAILEEAVRKGAAITKSEFVREATRRYLEALGFSLGVEPQPVKQEKGEVVNA